MSRDRCPQCHNRIIQKTGDTIRLRVKGPIVFDSAGNAHAECHWCRKQVDLPLTLDLGEGKILAERFFVQAGH